jgi:hypothetical protein
MDTTLLKKLQLTEAAYKQIEAERTDLRAQVIDMMKKDKVEKSVTEYGTFTVGRRTVWTYTDVVKTLEEKVKLAKVKEQQKGLATEGATEYLVYTA